MKDYYKILGVTKESSDDEIKKSYRELCKKYHPDRATEENKSEYEEKFKDINEAYQVLSNKEERQKYDNGGFNPEDFFKNFYSGFEGFGFDPFSWGFKQNRGPVPGNNIRLEIKCTLKQLYYGCVRTFKYNVLRHCGECNGSGIGPNGSLEVCPVCNGTGVKSEMRGAWVTQTTCDNCGGTGKIIKNPSEHCGGTGVVTENETVDVKIPAGGFNGMSFTIAQKGHCSMDNGINGDLIVTINEMEDDVFKRNGNDLYLNAEVPLLYSIIGGKIEIGTINGKKISVKIEPGTKNKAFIRINGYGMPIYSKINTFGDLYIIVNYLVPSKKELEKLGEDDIRKLTEIDKKLSN